MLPTKKDGDGLRRGGVEDAKSKSWHNACHTHDGTHTGRVEEERSSWRLPVEEKEKEEKRESVLRRAALAEVANKASA